MRLHILGAAGSGTTTLGAALAARLRCPHHDTDTFFWLPSDPPFTDQRPAAERVALLAPLLAAPSWVLSGSLCGWGDVFIPLFERVVFLALPHDARMARLHRREQERYGDMIAPGGAMHEASVAFLAWAARYDAAGLEQRSLRLHEDWLARLPCPVLRLDGMMPTEEQVARVMA
jgi:adenylate kinase family enzyme